MSSTTLTNLQLELLKLYATDLEESDLLSLKKLLADFFAGRAVQNADQIWDNKKYTNNDMDAWLNDE